MILGASYILTDLHGEAIEILKRGVIRNPEFLGNHVALAPLYAEMGCMEEAPHEIEEILRVSPHFSIEMLRGTIPSKDPAMIARLIKAFRKARLK